MLCSNTLSQKTSNIYQWGCVCAGECIQSVLFYFPLGPLTPPLREQTGRQEGMCEELIKVLCGCLISRVFLFSPHWFASMLLAPWRTATSGSEQLAFSVCLLLRLLLLLISNHAHGVFKDPFPNRWASSQVSRAAADFHELPHPRTAALIILDGRNDTYSYCSYLRFSRLWINTSLLYAFGQFPLVVFDNFFQFYNCFWGEDWAPCSTTLESAGQPATNFTYICVCYYLGVVSTLSLLYYFSLSETFCG